MKPTHLVQYLLAGLLSHCLFPAGLMGQSTLVQSIRGTVYDQETQVPLPGVTVWLIGDRLSATGTITDLNGHFLLEDVPVGRRRVAFSYLGYAAEQREVILRSGKELLLSLGLRESAMELAAVEVTAVDAKGDARNELATVSARTFSVEDTDRYAGSRGEPARMAANFAGVQGADDSRNDLVIRGNNPNGVIWRLEGFNIPNPNHFGIAGTGGGPVTILNNKFLANSDFFTGAFPAEFANGLAGAFDLRMRNGNATKSEQSIQLGFLGTDILLEGPLNREKGSSYLATFRYSTLELFDFLGIGLGTDAVPRYFDGAFRLNFPLKNNAQLSFWGIGGKSNIDILISDEERPDSTVQLFGDEDRDQYFGSEMLTVGANFTQPLRDKGYVKAGLAYAHAASFSLHDYVYRRVENDRYVVDSLPRMLDYRFTEDKWAAYAFVNRKLGAKASWRFGFNAEIWSLDYRDSLRPLNGLTQELAPWRTRWASKDRPVFFQPYLQARMQFNERWSGALGFTASYFGANDNGLSPFEPRLGLRYTTPSGERFNFGMGLHSQTQPLYLYYFSDSLVNGEPVLQNRDMGLSKSWHWVVGYERSLGKIARLKVETYYQWLFDIPITPAASSYSLANVGTGFARLFPPALENGGNGRNYGLELTVEKFYRRGFYFLGTASLFDAEYRGSDGVWRNSTFNGTYAFNLVAAKEYSFQNGNTLNIGGKYTRSGGRRYGPVDVEASQRQVEIVYADATVNTLQFPDYHRFDIRIAYNWNRPKVSYEFALDLVNVLAIQNILSLTYAPGNPNEPIQEEYQLGRLPIFYARVDF